MNVEAYFLKFNHYFLRLLIIAGCFSLTASVSAANTGGGNVPAVSVISAVNKDSQAFLPYDDVGMFHEGYAWYQEAAVGVGYIDTRGKVVVKAKYEIGGSFHEGLAAVKRNGKWGYINTKGQEVIKPQFDEVAFEFSEGLAQVRNGTKWGHIDRTGKVAIPLRFEDSNVFRDGLSHAKLGGKFGYIDKTGKFLIPANYQDASEFHEGLAPVKVGDKWGFVDRKGKLVIAAQYAVASIFSAGLAPVKIGKQWGYINKSGKQVISAKYDDAKFFADGLAAVKRGPLWGFVNQQGKEVIAPKYHAVDSWFVEGVAQVMMNVKIGSGVATELRGYIDRSGRAVYGFIPQLRLTPFNKGRAIACGFGKPSCYLLQLETQPAVQAYATKVTVQFNKQSVTLNSYSVNNNTYVTLDDVSRLLNGSSYRFQSIRQDKSIGTTYLEEGGSYKPPTGTVPVHRTQPMTVGYSVISSNSALFHAAVYCAQQVNYYKLSDIAGKFGLAVTAGSKPGLLVIKPK